MDKLNLNMVILSHLSDVQEELIFNPKGAVLRLNFVKFLLIEYKDTNIEIERLKLDEIWQRVEERQTNGI